MKERECKCTICKKAFMSNQTKAFTCGSKKCVGRNNYIRHKEVYVENSKRWSRENPERRAVIAKKACDKFRKEKPKRFNELVMNSYKRHKIKWQSRNSIRRVLNGVEGYVQYNPLKKKCKCGSIENLERHSENSPTKRVDIIKDINEGRIYYLCRKCNRGSQSHGGKS